MRHSEGFCTPASALLFAIGLICLAPIEASALPSFAVQTGQPCQACHVGGLGPQLTPFGREFKLHGYTARTVGFSLPLTAFAVASYVRTGKDQPTPPAPGFSANDNIAIDQVSLFLAGGFGSHLGAFVQGTYDGVGKSFTWDNVDVRTVAKTTLSGFDAVLGLSLNNSPTVQDAFNTLPAWGFPYSRSTLGPTPGAAPLIGSFAQNTLGLTGYAWINDQLYLELGAYRSLGAGFLIHAGVDPFSPGKINGFAPYARIVYQRNFGDRNFSIGAFGMSARLFPGRDESAGMTDRYADVGVDGSFQYFADNRDVVSVNARYTYERQRLNASRALGLARNAPGNLQDLRFDVSYYWRNKIGLTTQLFKTWGSRDGLLYAANRTFRPDSSGLTLQLDGTPYGDGRSPLGPRFNLRVGIQYTAYFTFNGAGGNFDGLGRNAADSNTLRVFSWIYY